jgi:hypothetical protein
MFVVIGDNLLGFGIPIRMLIFQENAGLAIGSRVSVHRLLPPDNAKSPSSLKARDDGLFAAAVPLCLKGVRLPTDERSFHLCAGCHRSVDDNRRRPIAGANRSDVLVQADA